MATHRLVSHIIVALAVLATLVRVGNAPVAFAAGATYYVDCSAGNDSNPGTAPTAAWRTLSKANAAPLTAGGQLLFKRGCTWTGTLHAKWTGTATEPVLIGAYGMGDLPLIRNAPGDIADRYHSNVFISGAYQIVEHLQTTIVNPPVDSGCENQTLGYYVGFNFIQSAHHNTLRYTKATRHMAGIKTDGNTHHNTIVRNTIIENNVMETITPDRQQADLGAWGMLLWGSYQDVGYNYLENNRAWCAYDFTTDPGNAIEIFRLKHSTIHHNRSVNDRDFSETGGVEGDRVDDVTYAYNVVTSTKPTSTFLIVRGAGNPYGPTYRIKAYNNTIYYAGDNSQGVVCHAECNADILTMRNNIVVATKKALYADGPLQESHNLYWHPAGTPFPTNFLQVFNGATLSSTSQQSNPQFVNPAAQDFHLRATSPAIDTGVTESMAAGYTSDFEQRAVYHGATVDKGAFEYQPSYSTLIPIALPGRVEAEAYREGGEGVGYHDTTAGNTGAASRTDDVDIQSTRDSSGTYNVGWVVAGEWLAYDVQVAERRNYTFMVRVASPNDGGRFHIEVDGVDVSGSIMVPQTSDWQTWANASSVPIELTAGRHVVKLVAETSGLNVNYIEVSRS